MVPVLNEAASLPSLLDELAGLGLLPVALFVDNGSSDGSAALIRARGAAVLHEARLGYGYPCLTGLHAARRAGADVVVFMEADGSDDPADVARLAGPVLRHEADLVIGSRREAVRRAAHMPLHQRIGNALTTVVLRLLFGLRLPDNGPFRAVRVALLLQLGMEPRAYAWTTEMTVKAHVLGARIIAMETAYRERRGQSKIAGTWRGTLGAFGGIFGTMLKLRFAGRGFAACRPQ